MKAGDKVVCIRETLPGVSLLRCYEVKYATKLTFGFGITIIGIEPEYFYSSSDFILLPQGEDKKSSTD